MRSRVEVIIFLAIAIIILLGGLANLGAPSFIWEDEGWTLTVARNWVERGHFGLVRVDEPVGPGLSASFPTVLSVALSFKIWGVGIWQARWPIVMYLFGSLALLYALTARIFDRRVALAAMGLAVLITADPFLNPIYLGRQILAEMPLMFFLLLGYAAFYLAVSRSAWWLLVAIGAWGWALVVKVQPLPFWAASVMITLAVAIIQRQWRVSILLLVGSLGAVLFYRQWPGVQSAILQGHTAASPVLNDLYSAVAMVLTPVVRIQTLFTAIQFGLPLFFGLAYTTRPWWSTRQAPQLSGARAVLHLMLVVCVVSWLVWEVMLSIGWTRYLFPPYFIGAMFVAALLKAWTNDFNWRVTLRRWSGMLRQWRSTRRLDRQALGGLLLVALLAAMLISTLRWSVPLMRNDDNALEEVAAYLRQNLPQTAIVETYDSPLFFFLQQRYHYPSDEISIPLSRRIDQGETVSIDYDAMTAHPDVIVVGPFSRVWQLYDKALASGQFQLVYSNSRYQVYQRTP